MCVRWKLKSDKRILDFLRGVGKTRILLLLFLGILLLLLSGAFMGSEVAVIDGPEAQLSELCSSLEGVGRCRVALTFGEGEEVYAVAVLCDGAENAKVRSKVCELISSLYGIGYNRISVLKISE